MTITPTVRIMDNSTLLIEGTLPTSESFNETLKEVYVQFNSSTGFTPISRHVFRPIKKTSTNEIIFQLIVEVK